MARMDVQTRVQDGVVVIAPRGELDVAGTPQLEHAVDAGCDGAGVEGVVIDLSGLEFMDSSGLRCVVEADQRVRSRGLRFALVPGGEPVQRVFEITRMTERLSWVDGPGDLAGERA
jgi:anti-anti-sigma factor